MNQKLPQHIAIVMDGNGRWAEHRGLPRVDGHRAGIEAVKTVVQGCLENHIPVLSLFAFSSENWSRPQMEVGFLMELFVHALEQEIQVLHEHGVSLRFIGKRSQLAENLCLRMQEAESLTRNNQKLILNIAVNYSGKWDILQAIKTLLAQAMAEEQDVEALNELVFARFLSTSNLPDPDLLIRTSGEQRISNFFLWQLAYTELYFTEVCWPDFNKIEFDKALRDFSLRERRYGQIPGQINGKIHV